jgi:hypothetical protein
MFGIIPPCRWVGGSLGCSSRRSETLGYLRELGEGRLEVVGDLLGEHVRRREVGGVFEGLVPEP